MPPTIVEDLEVNYAKDFSSFLSYEGRHREPSKLKSLIPYAQDKTNTYLASGLPRIDMFPIHELSFKAKDPITGKLVEHKVGQEAGEGGFGLNAAQQYGSSVGIEELRKTLRDFQARLHSPNYLDWDLIVTAGGTDSLYKSMNMFLERGMPIVMARNDYSPAIETFLGYGLNILTVDMDEYGIIPSSLFKVASEYNQAHAPVRCVYVVPCGQNPTGATMSKERRAQFYATCQQLNLLIFEDDPYFFFQLPKYQSDQLEDFLPSLLNLDTDGRVIRMDSFSKVIAPGLRLGTITAQSNLISKFQNFNDITYMQPSGYSQVIFNSLLTSWKFDGLLAHITSLRLEFALRRDKAMEILLPHSDILKVSCPMAGMFLWIELIHLKDCPFDALADNKVIVVPGKYFVPSPNPISPCLRICYTYANLDIITDALNVLVRTVRSLSDKEGRINC